MSITDELREWMDRTTIRFDDRGCLLGTAEELTAIADRIDAAHERAVMSAMNDALHHANDESMAELGWVRLPLDADGVPINIGDVIVYEDNTLPKQVVALMPPSVVMVEDGPRYADMCRHYHKLTVEDVLDENAKLRELVRLLLWGVDNDMPRYEELAWTQKVNALVRELGVEESE